MEQDTVDAAAKGDGATYVNVAGRRFRVPGSSRARLVVGTLCVVGGVLGFLPVLGFWMIPLGLLILSVDLPSVRRARRRTEVWTGRKVNGLRGNGKRARGRGSADRKGSEATPEGTGQSTD